MSSRVLIVIFVFISFFCSLFWLWFLVVLVLFFKFFVKLVLDKWESVGSIFVVMFIKMEIKIVNFSIV